MAAGRLRRATESRLWETRAALILSVAALVIGLGAEAHGPTPHRIDETLAIAAESAAARALVEDIANVAKWHPLVAENVAKSDAAQGELRVPILKSGGQIVDDPTEYDPAKMTNSHRRMDDVKALSVSSYTATIAVAASADETASVELIRRYY